MCAVSLNGCARSSCVYAPKPPGRGACQGHIPDIADALSTALAPLHLGVLPLCGAWWAGSHFNASLHAFVPQGALSPQQCALSLTATAILEDEEGNVLARCDCVCPPEGGALGTISAILPESSCVLQHLHSVRRRHA